MSATIDTQAIDTDGFERFYAENIEPELGSMEQKRRRGVIAIICLAGTALMGAALILVAANYPHSVTAYTGLGEFAAVGVGVVMLLGSVAVAFFLRRRIHGPFQKLLVGRTCEFLGLTYQRKNFEFPVERFHEAELVGQFTEQSLEDRISGEHDGVALSLCEAKLEKRVKKRDSEGNTKTETVDVFQGLLLVYNVPKCFSGTTVLVPDLTWVGNKLTGMRHKGDRVTLEESRFEECFEVYSSDQVEARYLLTPGFMERLADLGERFRDGDRHTLSAAFTDKQLLIAVESKRNHFEGGGIFKPLTDPSRSRALFAELSQLIEIIDALGLNNNSRA